MAIKWYLKDKLHIILMMVVTIIIVLYFNSGKIATFYLNRGLAYQNQGQYDQAISDYTKAIMLCPKFAIAYYNRANAFINKGQYDRAIADCTKAIKIWARKKAIKTP